MTYRLTCCVPFCRRTSEGKGFDEWICGDHWRAIPKPMRRVYGRRMRRWRRYGMLVDRGITWRLWGRLKRAAIERAAGL